VTARTSTLKLLTRAKRIRREMTAGPRGEIPCLEHPLERSNIACMTEPSQFRRPEVHPGSSTGRN